MSRHDSLLVRFWFRFFTIFGFGSVLSTQNRQKHTQTHLNRTEPTDPTQNQTEPAIFSSVSVKVFHDFWFSVLSIRVTSVLNRCSAIHTCTKCLLYILSTNYYTLDKFNAIQIQQRGSIWSMSLLSWKKMTFSLKNILNKCEW